MKRAKEIGGNILKYSAEKLQERSAKTTERFKRYAITLNEVSSELMYSSKLWLDTKAL